MLRPDPYLVLAEATGFIDYLPGHDGSPALDFILEVTTGGAQELRKLVDAGEALVNLAHLRAGSRFVTVRMPASGVRQLVAGGYVTRYELAEGLRHQRTLRPKTGGSDRLNPDAGALKVQSTSTTLAASIDDGCPFAHGQFRRPGGPGTRVVTLWDLDPDPEFPAAGAAAPAGFFRGREVPGTRLEEWMQAATVAGRLDESACYAAAQYSAVEVELTHGSHLLGTFAGDAYSRIPGGRDAAAEADIAFLQLPRRESESPGAGSVHACILDGLRYLRDFAEANGYQHCVVVCAWGSMLGPHDGSSLFEQALDAFLAEKGIRFDIVFPAGNGFKDKVHAVLEPKPGQPASIAWMLPADNEVPTFAELWIDGGAPEQVTVWVKAGGQSWKIEGNQPVEVAPWLVALRTDNQVTLRAAPTRVNEDGATQAKPGPVVLTAEAVAQTTLHGYLCWGGSNLGYVRDSQQARWYRLKGGGTSKLPGEGSVLGDACGSSPCLHVVGGYVGSNDPRQRERASYSATGPKRNSDESLPRILALSESDAVTRGILGPGTRTGLEMRIWGTSVAVPQYARALVNGEVQGGNTSLPDPFFLRPAEASR